jgi:hypothetical protein
MAGPEFVGQRFVMAAEASMELSGEVLELHDGELRPR